MVVVVVEEEVMVMEIVEEGLAMLHIRAATILAPTMEDITQGAEAHREDAVEVEATELSYSSLALFVFYSGSVHCVA